MNQMMLQTSNLPGEVRLNALETTSAYIFMIWRAFSGSFMSRQGFPLNIR
jgi:hypothetical protein